MHQQVDKIYQQCGLVDIWELCNSTCSLYAYIASEILGITNFQML